jgi:hypothetical protein
MTTISETIKEIQDLEKTEGKRFSKAKIIKHISDKMGKPISWDLISKFRSRPTININVKKHIKEKQPKLITKVDGIFFTIKYTYPDGKYFKVKLDAGEDIYESYLSDNEKQLNYYTDIVYNNIKCKPNESTKDRYNRIIELFKDTKSTEELIAKIKEC